MSQVRRLSRDWDHDIRLKIKIVADTFDEELKETLTDPSKTECMRTTVFQDGPYQDLADSARPRSVKLEQ